MKISKRQLRRIIKEEKAKVLAENRVRKAVRKALLKEAVPGGYPEEFGGSAGYTMTNTSDIQVGDYVEVDGVNGGIIRGIALKHGDSPSGKPIFVTMTKGPLPSSRPKYHAQIHMETEPDAKGRGGGKAEYVDFELYNDSRIKRANPGYQQQSLDL